MTMTLQIPLRALLIGFLLVAVLGVAPAYADEHPEWSPCGDEGDGSFSGTIQIALTIMSALGPVFGTLFFAGLTVAGAASAEQNNNYGKKRRKVIIYGFSVPVAIAFLGVISNELTEPDISCFFPG